MTEAATTPSESPPASPESRAGAKVVQLREAVQKGAGALNDWAQDQAGAIATTAKERPLAVAGISAGTAFGIGLILGLLLARSAPEPTWKERILELKPNW